MLGNLLSAYGLTQQVGEQEESEFLIGTATLFHQRALSDQLAARSRKAWIREKPFLDRQDYGAILLLKGIQNMVAMQRTRMSTYHRYIGFEFPLSISTRTLKKSPVDSTA